MPTPFSMDLDDTPSTPPPTRTTKPAKSSRADRGKWAEAQVGKALHAWAEGHADREYNRLPDTKSARMIIKAAPADFDYHCPAASGLVEVKETRHRFRLGRDKVPQLARLLKRQRCGGKCGVLVYHGEVKVWRAVPATWLGDRPDVPSWDLSELRTHPTVESALKALVSEAFA